MTLPENTAAEGEIKTDNGIAGNRSVLVCAGKMSKELLCGFTGFAVHGTEDNSFVGLAIQHDCSVVCGQHKGNYRKVFFTVNNNRGRGISDRTLQRADQLVRECAGRIFHLDTFTMDYWYSVAGDRMVYPSTTATVGVIPFFWRLWVTTSPTV